MLNRIKKFFKENWKFLIFILVFYFVMNYELPYVIYTPGGAINMSDRVKGDNTYQEDGSLSMTYVSLIKGSVPFLALSYIMPNWDIVPKDDVTYGENDLKETLEIDKIYMKEAISNAEYVAYTASNIPYSKTKSKVVITYVAKNAKTNLKYNDELVSIDGIEFSTLKEIQDYITTKNVGDEVTTVYIRDGKTHTDKTTLIDIGGVPKAGISIAALDEYETPYNISVKTKSSESGPSGGLITALEIYNKITEYDITNGKTIMGTGTIEKDGTVGEIGGVKYKLIGAVKNGADVFICPKENYEEAKKVKEENDYDIALISAGTFEEALENLMNLN